MEYRALGNSGLRVSVLAMGTMTFGGRGPFASVGSTDVSQAGRQVDMCLDAGVNLIAAACPGPGRCPTPARGRVAVPPPARQAVISPVPHSDPAAQEQPAQEQPAQEQPAQA